jgi:hypothetical protein
MSNQTRSILKIVAVILVLLTLVMQLHWVSIPAINPYKYWMVVVAFGMLLVSSK